MDKVKVKLLEDLKRSNKERKQKLAEKFGFTTVEAYLSYLNDEEYVEKVAPVTGNKTDIVIAFDTTGSMSSYIKHVKKHVKELIPELFEKTTDLKISIVAFGDYCDMESATKFGKAYQVLGLTDDKTTLINFVNTARDTVGGDSDEFYELVIKKITEETDWREGSNKSVLLIADCNPHPVGYSYGNKVRNAQIDWRVEAKKAKGLGIKIDTLAITGERWYKELAEITDGVYLKFQSSGKTANLLEGYTYARTGTAEAFAASRSVVEASGDEELIGVYKTLSTL